MEDELAVLCHASSELEIQALRDLLDDAEIPVIVKRAQVPGYPGTLELYAGYYAALLVHATDRYRASRVIEDWQDRRKIGVDDEADGLALDALPEPVPPRAAYARHVWSDALTAALMLLALPVLVVTEIWAALKETKPTTGPPDTPTERR